MTGTEWAPGVCNSRVSVSQAKTEKEKRDGGARGEWLGQRRREVLNNTLALFDEFDGIRMVAVIMSLTSIEHLVCARTNPKRPLFLTRPSIFPVTLCIL